MNDVMKNGLDDLYLDPSRKNFDAFKALPRDEPIDMLNMIEFRETALYPQDHPHATKGWDGARAYTEYGSASGSIFQRVGGQIIWSGNFQAMVIGPDHKSWDRMFIARYPHSGAFLEMVTDAQYQRAVVHRTAALLTSRLIRMQPVESQNGTFG